MILRKLIVGPIASNCYLIGSETTGEGMIVDPGDEASRILNTVKELGLEIKFIVLTHTHWDHMSALSEVSEATAAEVCVHTDESGSIPARSPSGVLDSPAAPVHWLRGGDGLDVGDLRFLVIHTPGHTPGSICLLGNGILFSGDTLFNCGVGRTDLPGSSHRQLMDSLTTKLMILPDDTTVYPGHGPDTTIGAERRTNPFIRG